MIVSILESIYLIYMFRYFETSVDFNIFSSPDGYWLKHMIGNKKGQRICPFGHVAIFGLVAVLLIRHFAPLPKKFILIALSIAVFLSLVNLNALVYLLPVIGIEYYMYIP